jgi:thiol-disulfide isomerase/thioredoxin
MMKKMILLLGMMLVLQVQGAQQLPPGIIQVLPTFQAPQLKLADMDGNSQDLQDYRGQWVFVHFWASWCGPCRREIPAIQDFVQKMAGKDIGIMIINTAESEDTVLEFLFATAPELNSLLDRDGLATEAWKPRGLPATYLVDPQGVVRYQALGGRPWNTPTYLQFIESLLKQK